MGVCDSMRVSLLALSFLLGLLAAPLAADESAVMKRGVKLFTDREYVIDEMPDAVKDLPFHRTSIEKTHVTVTKPGTLFALTPTTRPKASSQEEPLREAGFAKVDGPEVQFFPGEVNRVSLYRKAVKAGERLQLKNGAARDGGWGGDKSRFGLTGDLSLQLRQPLL